MGRAAIAAALPWLLLGLAHAVPAPVALGSDAQLHHCAGACPSRGATAALAISLLGAGAHRHLEYRLTMRCPPEGDTGDRDTQRDAAAPPPTLACDAALLQPLPAAVYADVYELDNAAARGRGPAVKLFGPVDVESIEARSQPTLLAVYASPTPQASQQARDPATRCRLA